MRILSTGLGLAVGLIAGAALAQDGPLLGDMFSDHAVLQRDKPLAIWGEAKAGEAVTVRLKDTTLTATADAKGQWQVTYPATTAGGPYQIEVTAASGARQVVQDVMFGDVFLCSGQSNMQWGLQGIIGAGGLIATSKNDTIRMMTVALEQSLEPQRHFPKPVKWQTASPETVPSWSAVCYTFARDLQTTTKTPIGLINSAWGGARIEPWMSEAGLRPISGYASNLDLLAAYRKDPVAASQTFGKDFARWWAASGGTGTPWAISARDMAKDWAPVTDVTLNWEDWGVPTLSRYDGPLWYGATVRLTAKQAREGAVLNLGPIDEFDTTWVNGVAVGYTSGAGTPRAYTLPKGVLKAGDNVIAVLAVDTWAKGGFYSAAERNLTLGDGTKLALDKGWRYASVPAGQSSPPRAPWDPTGGLTTIHNAMIAPIGPYGLKGALWYQGESNAGDPSNYQALLTGYMADWRQQFGAELPFLIVQLPNFGARPTAPVDAGWARMREAQRLAVKADGNAALAVTIDLGDPLDIHPLEKNMVGKRLSRAARSLIYKENITPSGPVPLDAVRANDTITVRFGDIDGALISYGTRFPVSFEVCGDDRNACQYVVAELKGPTVELRGEGVSAARYVRYCWADSPTCTLYDQALPAGPFEIAISPAQ